jgi:hypothetical protein
MQVNKVDKLLPNVFNEDRGTCVKVALRKLKNVGDGGPTREEGKGTGGHDAVTMTGDSGRAGCDDDPSRRCREVKTRTKREGGTWEQY